MKTNPTRLRAFLLILTALTFTMFPVGDAAAQSYDPNGDQLTSDVTLVTVAAVPGSGAPTKALYIAGTDGTNARPILTDSLGRLNMIGAPATATRHDFGPTLASGATQLTSGAGTLLSSNASTAAALGANICLYDGNPASGGVLIQAFNILSGAVGTASGASPSGIPYTNGLWVRAGSVLVGCTSLGVSLSLGFGNVVTSP